MHAYGFALESLVDFSSGGHFGTQWQRLTPIRNPWFKVQYLFEYFLHCNRAFFISLYAEQYKYSNADTQGKESFLVTLSTMPSIHVLWETCMPSRCLWGLNSYALGKTELQGDTLVTTSAFMWPLTCKDYSAPNKESTFSEILISAVKSTFSHSNHHKSIKEPLWRSFLRICFSPYITHREAIEVQK